MAIVGVMHAVAQRGLRVPDDLSIVALVSSAREAEMTLPPLTAMSSPSDELGRLGVDVLIERLEGDPRDATHRCRGCCRVSSWCAAARPRRASGRPLAARRPQRRPYLRSQVQTDPQPRHPLTYPLTGPSVAE